MPLVDAGRRLARTAVALGLSAVLAMAGVPAPALAQGAGPPSRPAADVVQPLPSFAELEAAGARIRRIVVVADDIFDLADSREDKLLFRWANALHVQTKASVVEAALLFKAGDRLSLRLIEETERLLRATRYLADVQIEAVAFADGMVDIAVRTRDAWTLDPGVSVGRAGGQNTGSLHLRDYNVFGTGATLGYARVRGVDRSGNEIALGSDNLGGSRLSFSLLHASNSDGKRSEATFARPFYALDTRWAAGASASDDDRIDPLYNAGVVVGQYRHRERRARVFGGFSPGLAGGWVQRFVAGLQLQDDAYAVEPGLTAPAKLPAGRKLIGPYLRYELIEDRYDRQLNRNLIGRPEFFALGLAASVQLGRASRALGSSDGGWLYAATIGRGFEPAPGQLLTTTASLAGQRIDGAARRQRLAVQAQYYLPQGKRWLFYASASADRLTGPELPDLLLLGGDNGLRGYPLRYQTGERRALLTLEERFFTDLYVWRLFRVGGALFFDAGRAWGSDLINPVHPGWLADIGAGLRIVNARSAFSNVVHIDLALPLQRGGDLKSLQLLVKSRTTF